jgi:hypothetical protein
LAGFAVFLLQGWFLWTSVFLRVQYRATKVLQLPDPSRPVSFGMAACLHVRSQKSKRGLAVAILLAIGAL